MSPPAIPPGAVVRIRGQRWRVTHYARFDEAAILSVGGCDRDNSGETARFLLPAERIDDLAQSGMPKMVGARAWRRAVRRILADTVPRFDSLRAATTAQISIVPFQLEPALAVLGGLGSRVLIADEVGLGKTIQAALIVAEIVRRDRDARVLVVSPAALKEQWAGELLSRFDLHTASLDGPAVMRLASLAVPGVNPWAACPLIVTSIDYVKRPEVIRALEPIVWDAVVFDEAHALSGASDRAAAANSLARRARVVVLLSATPHSGDASAFSRLCRIGSLTAEPLLVFRRSRQDAGLPSSRATRWLRVRPTAAERSMHQALVRYAGLVWAHADTGTGGARLAMVVLLKRACSSAAALARSIHRRLELLADRRRLADGQLPLPFAPDEADAEPLAVLAAPGLTDVAEERRQLTDILTLARIASHHESKLHAVQRLLRRAREPAIVFTEYRDTLAHLGAALAVDAVHMHGAMTASERRDAVRAFTTSDVPLLLATDAASEGLNLHHRCRLVINLELPWTPVRLEQRVGRVDRFGQPSRVHAVHLVGRGTAEEETVARLVWRHERARQDLAPDGLPADEYAVARTIVGATATPAGAPRPQPAQPSPADLVFPGLIGAARDEARRILIWRALRQPHGRTEDTRPPVTRVRRRDGSRPRAYWAVRVQLLGSAGDVCWNTVAAAETSAPATRLDPTSAAAIFRLAIENMRTALIDSFREGGVGRREALEWVRRALRRERDIAKELRDKRARLAALQPSLFDRRAERDRAAQTAVLEEALGQCHQRTLALEHMLTLRVGPLEPLFALMIG